MADSETCYPDALITRLVEAWKPPHRTSLAGDESGVPFSDGTLRTVVEQAFFASLRAEEGRFLRQRLVLVAELNDLSYLKWDLVVLETPVEFGAGTLAKLAPALGSDRYAVVSTANGNLQVKAIGQPNDGPWLFAEDHYPRIQTLGPADLVFLKGSSAIVRYRAGEVAELENDFLASAPDEPATATRNIMTTLFAHREGAVNSVELDMVRTQLAELFEAVSAVGHGGMLAILSPNDPEESNLLQVCDYRIKPMDIGDIIVSVIEGAQSAAQIEERVMLPPDFIPVRAYTSDELGTQMGLKDSETAWRRARDAVAGAASVDGAVLLNANLCVLGFGCKLPRAGTLPTVSRPLSNGDFASYDLSKRGTRHAAAAQFADRPGRMAVTFSADGPVGCFMWSIKRGERIYWPVHVGSFAPNRW